MLTRAPMRKSAEYDNDQRILAGLAPRQVDRQLLVNARVLF